MTTRTKTGLEILQVSAALGVLGNVLLRQTPWGLNAFLFVAAFVAALLILTKRHRPELLTAGNLALSGAMLFFASMFLIRDAEELLVWDTLAILVIMGVLLLANLDVCARIAGVFHYAAGFVWSGLTSAFGPFVLLGSDIDWKEMPGNKISQNLFAVLRGLAIALPLLLIFGGLFMAADAVFEGMVNRAFNFDLENLISHVLLTSLFAWLTAGYFRGTLVVPFAAAGSNTEPVVSPIPKTETKTQTRAGGSESAEERGNPCVGKGDTLNSEARASAETDSFVAKVVAEAGEEANLLPNNATILEHINISDPPNDAEFRAASGSDRANDHREGASTTIEKKRDFQNLDSSKLPSVFTLGAIETVLVLGLVDLLFLAFVAVQVPYLFGGMELVQNTPDFKLAEYARRGFGELVAVAALVLPMLLLSHWLLRKESTRAGQIYKIFAGVQIALLFVIMASAVQRLVLLTGELGYGLTTVRFYPMMFMTWLAVVFIWFAVTVLRGKRNHFAWGALWAAIFVLGTVNLINPHAFIVRTNLKLMEQGREFDAYYNSRELSDDAVPAMIGNFEKLSMEDAQVALSELQWRACRTLNEADLRSWNLSRRRAVDLLNSTGIRPDEKICGRHYSKLD